MSNARRYPCPSCGAPVVFNDKTKTAAHLALECAWFTKTTAKLGGSPGRRVYLDADGNEVPERPN